MCVCVCVLDVFLYLYVLNSMISYKKNVIPNSVFQNKNSVLYKDFNFFSAKVINWPPFSFTYLLINLLVCSQSPRCALAHFPEVTCLLCSACSTEPNSVLWDRIMNKRNLPFCSKYRLCNHLWPTCLSLLIFYQESYSMLMEVCSS